MIGSILVNFTGDTYEDIDSGCGVTINGANAYGTDLDTDRIYATPVRLNDTIDFIAVGRPAQTASLNITRRDYTTINENNDKGIKDTFIYSGSALSYISFTTTATTLNSAYDFEYRVEATVTNP